MGKFKMVGGVVLGLGLLAVWAIAAPVSQDQLRRTANKSMQDGNYKDAYESFRKLALDKDSDPLKVGNDLTSGLQCLRNLGRSDEVDAFREEVLKTHARNWRLLQTAAHSFVYGEHYGYIVAGEFYRGHKRGGGRFVGTTQRDRTRALQLMQQALPLMKDEPDRSAAGGFYLEFARLLLNGSGYYEPWRLQYLTDLSKLPDYEDGRYWWYRGTNQGAPVDAAGNPVYYSLPKSFEAAINDGERWRWMLLQAAEADNSRLSETEMILADFCRSQFGAQTMASVGFSFQSDDQKADTGPFALHTLKENETIARLATGLKRFSVPDEFNWITIYNRVAERGKNKWGESARDQLASVYENRRQYPSAAAAWRKAIEEYGAGVNNARKNRLDQIVNNWGRFEPGRMQPSGKGAVVDFRFRNGKKVSFEAFAIKVPKLLEDVKNYLRGHQGQLNYNQFNIGNIGYRLVELQQAQYLGEKVATWDLDLTPRPDHFDDLVTVTTPLQKPGAYLVNAQMENGNTSRIIVWVADTVIVKKSLEGQAYYFLADAVTGKPVADAKLDFFGWRQVQVQPNRNQWKVDTLEFAGATDADGQFVAGPGKQAANHQWLVTATTAGKGRNPERFAYLGFTHVWYGQRHDPEYNATKVLTITDRPVYRPEQTVQFKAWVRHAKYDQPDASDFAGRTFTVQIHNPKGEKVYDHQLTADEYGGLNGEFPLSKGVTLGVYSLQVLHHGGGSFRVEEYKKPEFEVTVEAPKEPIRLGEKVEAKVQAKYYFGGPVTRAKVKLKVMRTVASASWFPAAPWDWFYGNGYWWFAPDYAWYRGWAEWGCRAPIRSWWGFRSEPPEIVSEQEVEIGADGTVKVPIDTTLAKEIHGNQDHKYTITAEVTDESRRTIVGSGDVLVSRKPFMVYTWLGRGYYRAGDTVVAHFKAQTLDRKPVQGTGELILYKISYDEKNEPVEEAVEKWKLDTNEEGYARQQLVAAESGQYRLSYKLTDTKKHVIEGGQVFVVRGDGFDGREFRFNDLELVTDKREYKPGEAVLLQISTNRPGAAVVLFLRPTNGIYLPPKVIHLKGKSTVEEIAVVQRDMPNFYIEALTVSDARVHTEIREVVVPPEKRVINVEVLASKTEYKPGEKATVKVKLTDLLGKPFVGSTVLTMYDKSVEYISGGSNVPEIKEFFWKWRRHHSPQTETNLNQYLGNLLKRGEIGMNNLGVFGDMGLEETWGGRSGPGKAGGFGRRNRGGMDEQVLRKDAAKRDGVPTAAAPPAPGAEANALGDAKSERQAKDKSDDRAGGGPGGGPAAGQEPTVRKDFADTAYWAHSLNTDKDGLAEVEVKMPENLTAWKIRLWAMGHGTKVGQGEAEVTTKKDLLVRLQAPRFFVQKDEVVLSANVHNYLKTEKTAQVSLELDGGTLQPMGSTTQKISIAAGGEKRVDWRVKVTNEGEAVVRIKAITDEESDAMEMRFPCYVHGMLKMEAISGVIRPDKDTSKFELVVPAERRINETRLEVRYSPTLAGAMVDALPYLVEYPYGCTEQTLNRFLPTVITQNILKRMNLDLKDIEKKRTNLNAQEIGDDQKRAEGWKRYPRNPVFNEAEVKTMSAEGVKALVGMQLADGGWGWFSGFGEQSWPHTTAVVVHGLQLAKANGVEIPAGVIERGIAWLANYQNTQLLMLKNASNKVNPWKEHADNIDAMVYMILTDQGAQPGGEMRDFLYRDRTKLAVYAKAMFGLALQKEQQAEKLAMILQNIEQFVVQDDENQTAYLKLPANNYWWYWYGSEVEANAYYLKLLSRTNPKDEKASRLVKYLLNNRKHATYWTNTRDTAIAIEALAEYLTASGEDRPDMTVEIWLDGKKSKEVAINAANLFTFDNKLVLIGDALDTGKHTVEIKRKGTGPVYFNAYLTNFTLEDHITRAGLEVKVNRKVYKLTPVDQKIKVTGSRGQAVDQKVEKFQRTELQNLATLKSGDLVEVELEIDSKNDYEYLIFEDMKAAGFEPMAVRSGYNGNVMGAYMELRDERVSFFVRWLARGKHSVSYRLRAEIPGQFSALPAKAYAMYAPELKGNSDEIKLRIVD